MEPAKTYDNIVLFTNGAIGDFLMGILCVDSVIQKLPKSRAIILTPRNAEALRGLLSAYPHIQVHEANRYNLLAVLGTMVRVMGQRNMAVNQVVLKKKAPFHMRTLARLLTMRRGSVYLRFAPDDATREYRGEKGVAVFDYHLPVYENLTRLFNTQNLGIAPAVPRYRLVPSQDVLNRYHLIPSSYVVVHPCAFSASRSLPAARWASILAYTAAHFPTVKIVITGSAQDRPFIERILEKGGHPLSILNLAGKLSLSEVANIVDGARGYIGVDTGITHLAGVLQKRSVIIGNLSNPYWLPRYNKNAIILAENKNCTCDGKKGGDCFYHFSKEKYYRCMLDIPNEVIFESIKNMFVEASPV